MHHAFIGLQMNLLTRQEGKMKSMATRPTIDAKSAPSVILESEPSIGAQKRLDWIATTAYYKAEARGFVPNLELDDWLEAEAEFEERLEY
jgi:hypothetical protein